MSWFSAFYSQQRMLRVLTSVIALTPLTLHAQTAPKAPAKASKVEDKTAPIILQAETVSGRPERNVKLEKNAELVRDKTRVTANEVRYNMVEDEIEAEGGVRMQRFSDVYTGEKLKLRLDSGQGHILAPTYQLEMNHAQGNAERVDFLDQDQAQINNGTYSTCEGPDPAWYLKSETLNLDFGRDVGNAGKTVVYFKNLPILGTPLLSFPLSNARRSGLLPPTFGATSTGGVELTLPYYFNIAPNRDVTLYPKLISRRGLQLGTNLRYMGGNYFGESNWEFLPQDRKANRNRYALSSVSNHQLGGGFGLGWNINTASDNEYPNDFAGSSPTNAQRQLVREMRLDYNGSWFNTSMRVQNYQILQDPAALLHPEFTVNRPYDRLPEFNFNGVKRDVAGFDFSLDAQWTRFSHPDNKFVSGQRMILHPQLSYPILSPAYFLTPKISLHTSRYQIKRQPGDTGMTDAQRTVPTFSLDSGVVFERETNLFGRGLTQTLEPRLFYVNTPYRDQRDIPVFDSAEAGFNFAQLFTENRFTGYDRISDANQVTLAMVSRVLESDGAERLRFALGQRFYFRNQRVTLDASSSEIKDSKSDLLLAASGVISPHWNFDSGLQYSVSKHQVYASNYGVQWQPKPKHVVNAEYRYQRGSFELLNLSGQWPIAQRYYAVGRISYSLPERQTVKSLAGFEYNADCWVFRFAAQRFSTSTTGASTSWFLQLELNGLSRIGPNPLDALSKNIPGYQKVNQPDLNRP